MQDCYVLNTFINWQLYWCHRTKSHWCTILTFLLSFLLQHTLLYSFLCSLAIVFYTNAGSDRYPISLTYSKCCSWLTQARMVWWARHIVRSLRHFHCPLCMGLIIMATVSLSKKLVVVPYYGILQRHRLSKLCMDDCSVY